MSKHPVLVRACSTSPRPATFSSLTQHKVYSLTDVATAQIIGTVHVCFFRRLEWSQADCYPGLKRSMHLTARFVGSGMHKAMACEACSVEMALAL